MGKRNLAAIVGLAVALMAACGVAVAATVTHGFTGRQTRTVVRALPQPTVTATVRITKTAIPRATYPPDDGSDPGDDPQNTEGGPRAVAPRVIGLPLDIAEYDIEAAGYSYVVSDADVEHPSHWRVVRQRTEGAVTDPQAPAVMLYVQVIPGESD